MKHTKGKWVAVKYLDEEYIGVGVWKDGSFVEVAHVTWYGDDDCNAEEDEANATLIAAAPATARHRDKLLAACEGLVKAKDEMEEDEGYSACECGVMADKPCDYCKATAAIEGK